MDDFEVKRIELGEDPAVDSAVLLLIEDALGGKRFLPEFKKRINYASGTTIVFGGYIGDQLVCICLLYTSPSPRDKRQSRMPSSA